MAEAGGLSLDHSAFSHYSQQSATYALLYGAPCGPASEWNRDTGRRRPSERGCVIAST